MVPTEYWFKHFNLDEYPLEEVPELRFVNAMNGL